MRMGCDSVWGGDMADSDISAGNLVSFRSGSMLIYGYPEQPPRFYTGSETNFSILVKNPLLDESIRKREDLVGKRIITIAGFSYGGLYTYLADPANQIQNSPAKTHQASRWLTGWLAAAGLLLFSVGAASQQSLRSGTFPEIEYGYPDQSIFVATVNDKGQPDSPMTRLAGVLLERAGIPWRAAPYPASRLFSNLQNGTTSFSILVRGSSLEACCLFSRQPVYRTELKVYYLGDKPSVKSKNDLAGKRIITIRGYSYAGLLKFIGDPANRIVNEVAGTHKAAFEMLAAQRADYVVDYASAAGDILAESPQEDLRSNPIDRLDIYLVLSKSYPDAEKLMVRLEEIAKTLNVPEILKGRGGGK